ETSAFPDLLSGGYYRVHQQQVLFQPSFDYFSGERLTLSLASSLKYTSTELRDATLLPSLMPYGSEKNMVLASFTGEMRFDTRDNSSAPAGGILLDAQGSYSPALIDNKFPFEKFRSEARTYIFMSFLLRSTVAVRVPGEKTWG